MALKAYMTTCSVTVQSCDGTEWRGLMRGCCSIPLSTWLWFGPSMPGLQLQCCSKLWSIIVIFDVPCQLPTNKVNKETGRKWEIILAVFCLPMLPKWLPTGPLWLTCTILLVYLPTLWNTWPCHSCLAYMWCFCFFQLNDLQSPGVMMVTGTVGIAFAKLSYDIRFFDCIA